MKPSDQYEEIAQYLLNEIAERFGLSHVEGKQKIQGRTTKWEIDAKGVREEDGAIVVIECRRYTTRRLEQKDLGSFAYTIGDIGAAGGITVTPLGHQAGAERIAAAENIVGVTLTPESTTKEFLMNFLDQVFTGRHKKDSVPLDDSVKTEVSRVNGNVEKSKFDGMGKAKDS